MYHNEVREAWVQIRSLFWIPKGKQTVKRAIRRCMLCKRLKELPYPPPLVSVLPEFREIGLRTFESVVVGRSGPVYTKMHSKNKQVAKCCIGIIPCATSRTVHVNVLVDQSTEVYLQNQRQFIAWRGVQIILDNGKTFKRRLVRKYNAKHIIKWKFNLTRATWCGDMFELLIRLVNRCLIKYKMKMHLTYEELTTVTPDIEGILNNHPLTYTYDNQTEKIFTLPHLYCEKRFLDVPDDSADARTTRFCIFSEEVETYEKNHLEAGGR